MWETDLIVICIDHSKYYLFIVGQNNEQRKNPRMIIYFCLILLKKSIPNPVQDPSILYESSSQPKKKKKRKKCILYKSGLDWLYLILFGIQVK